MLHTKHHISQDGFTLVEVVVSMVLFAIMGIILAQLFASGTLSVVQQSDRRKATFLAQESMETSTGLGFAALSNITPTVMNATTGYTYFTRSVNSTFMNESNFSSVSATATNAIRLTVIVGSSQADTGFQDVTLQNVVTNWQ